MPKKAQSFVLIAHPETPDNVCWKIENEGNGKTAI